MKKIFTLVLSITLFTTAFAQYDRGNQQDFGNKKDNDAAYNDNRSKKGGDHFTDNYSFNKREIEIKIAQINREYEYKIRSVKNNYFMSWIKKNRMICKLEEQRQYEIKNVYERFNGHRNHYDDHDSKKNW
jgi:hypothetical protein